MTANRITVAVGHIGPHSGSVPHMTVSREWWEQTSQGATYQARRADERESASRLRAEARREHVAVVQTAEGATLTAVDVSGRLVAVQLGQAQILSLIADLFAASNGEEI